MQDHGRMPVTAYPTYQQALAGPCHPWALWASWPSRALDTLRTCISLWALWALCALRPSRACWPLDTLGTCCAGITLEALRPLDALGSGVSLGALWALCAHVTLWACRTLRALWAGRPKEQAGRCAVVPLRADHRHHVSRLERAGQWSQIQERRHTRSSKVFEAFAFCIACPPRVTRMSTSAVSRVC